MLVRISFMLMLIKLMLILTNSFVAQCVQFNQMKAFAADAFLLADAVQCINEEIDRNDADAAAPVAK